MKKLLLALFVALLMVGCMSEIEVVTIPGVLPIDLDDPETLDKIISEAIDGEKLQWRGKEELAYAPNQQTPYSGWTKRMYDNGRISGLYQYKDGKRDGLWTGWHRNGQKAAEGTYEDGKVVRD